MQTTMPELDLLYEIKNKKQKSRELHNNDFVMVQ